METQEVWVGLQIVLIAHCRRGMLWCEVCVSRLVGFSLVLVISTGEIIQRE